MKPADLRSAVLVITSDDATGYKIEKTLGVVAGAGSGAGRGAQTKAAEAWQEALLMLRQNAYDVGANGVIGIGRRRTARAQAARSGTRSASSSRARLWCLGLGRKATEASLDPKIERRRAGLRARWVLAEHVRPA